MISRMKAAVIAASGLLALTAGASVSRAEILATAARAGNFTSTATGPIPIPLTPSNSTALAFSTTVANQRVRIIYNAECGALGNSGAWISVVIEVDGRPAAPNSGTAFALCTASSTTTFIWTGATRQSTIVVKTPGLHTVTVTGQQNGTTELWLGDSSTIVDR